MRYLVSSKVCLNSYGRGELQRKDVILGVKIVTVCLALRREAPTLTPIRLRCAYCARTLALRTAEGSMALLDLAVIGDWLWRGEPLVIEAVGTKEKKRDVTLKGISRHTKNQDKLLSIGTYRRITQEQM